MPACSERPRRCIRQPGSAVTSASTEPRACELVVGHRRRELRLPDGERPAEAAAEIRSLERHDLGARALEKAPRLRRGSAARGACGTSRGRRRAVLRSSAGSTSRDGEERRQLPDLERLTVEQLRQVVARHRRAGARRADDRQLAREGARERLRDAAGGGAVAGVEGGLSAAHLVGRKHDLAPGLAQQRLGVGDRVRQHEIAQARREQLHALHARDSTDDVGSDPARAGAGRAGAGPRRLSQARGRPRARRLQVARRASRARAVRGRRGARRRHRIDGEPRRRDGVGGCEGRPRGDRLRARGHEPDEARPSRPARGARRSGRRGRRRREGGRPRVRSRRRASRSSKTARSRVSSTAMPRSASRSSTSSAKSLRPSSSRSETARCSPASAVRSANVRRARDASASSPRTRR